MTIRPTTAPPDRASRLGAGMVSDVQRTANQKPLEKPVDAVGNLKGFGPLTRLATSFGEMHAQTLRERDMLRTRQGGFVKIERVDRIVLDEEFLKYHPEALPIRIRAGAFGRNLPAKDVTLAPFQNISVSQRISGSRISRAIDALGRPSIMRVPETIITYTVIKCERPVSVQCEGLWVDL